MKKLKICIISLRSLPLYDESYNSENVMGGAEVNLYNLAICFSRMKNIEVQVLVDNYGQPAIYRKNNIKLIRFGSASGTKVLPRKIAGLYFYKQLISLDADVFIFSCSHALLGKLVLIQKFLKKKKVIFRLSSDLNMDMENFKAENGCISYLSYKFGLLNASMIISQTEKQKIFLENIFGKMSYVIENGFFIQGNIDVKKKNHILWVGRCMKSKRPMLFIELAKCLPEEEFIMIMPINKEIPPDRFKETEKLAMEVYRGASELKNVKVIDYVEYNKIQAYFDSAKAYVCTSELEGFPNTFIQACLGGTPIITYNVNPDNIVEKYRLGCFCNDNVKDAVSFIRGINHALQLEYKDRMKKYAAQKHNIYDTAKKYLKLIDKDFASDVETYREANINV